jgi:hypothetical protein
MPPDERLGTDDFQHRRKPSIQLDKDQAIAVGDADTTCYLPPQHNQLISERGVLCASSRPLDFNGEANNVTKKHNKAVHTGH